MASSRAPTSTWCCTGRAVRLQAPTASPASSADVSSRRGSLPASTARRSTTSSWTIRRPTRLDGRGADAARRFARAVLTDHFGRRALAGLTIPAVTDWRGDPLSRAAWASVPPGRYAIRDDLKSAVGGRIWFAGEALSRAQSGTVGGAWEDGERAAEAIIERLGARSAAAK